jgi:hypothetical protein
MCSSKILHIGYRSVRQSGFQPTPVHPLLLTVNNMQDHTSLHLTSFSLLRFICIRNLRVSIRKITVAYLYPRCGNILFTEHSHVASIHVSPVEHLSSTLQPSNYQNVSTSNAPTDPMEANPSGEAAEKVAHQHWERDYSELLAAGHCCWAEDIPGMNAATGRGLPGCSHCVAGLPVPLTAHAAAHE